MTRGMQALLAGVVAGFVCLVGLWLWHDRAETQARSVGIDVSRTLTASFAGMNALKVGTVSGDVLTSSNSTAMFGTLPVVQRTRAPYSVDYFVDLSRLSVASYRWNAKARTMSIDVPDVTIAAPNIDTSHAQVTQQGLYIPRAAGVAMQRQAAERATAVARRTADAPRYRDQARANARRAIAQVVQAPLQAAGFGNVRVAVRFPDDPHPENIDRETWDESTPLAEILRR